ncbi:hypothetical protein JCM19379_00040 [Methyloparacoccus murrellii]
MLKSYEAIYDRGRLQWVDQAPRIEHARVMVIVAEPDQVTIPPEHPADQVDQLLARTAGAWGRHSTSEVKARMAKQRQADWGSD